MKLARVGLAICILSGVMLKPTRVSISLGFNEPADLTPTGFAFSSKDQIIALHVGCFQNDGNSNATFNTPDVFQYF